MAKSTLAGFNVQKQAMLMHYGQVESGRWPPLRLQLVGKMLLEDKDARAKGTGRRYHPDDAIYWQKFEQRLEEKYRGAVR